MAKRKNATMQTVRSAAAVKGAYRGHAGVQRCGDWCRHYVALDEERWPGFGRCVHPLSVRSGEVFRAGNDCAVGEAAVADTD